MPSHRKLMLGDATLDLLEGDVRELKDLLLPGHELVSALDDPDDPIVLIRADGAAKFLADLRSFEVGSLSTAFYARDADGRYHDTQRGLVLKLTCFLKRLTIQ